MDWTVCRVRRGGGSATVNKRQIVRNTGSICDLYFIPQLSELKFGAFLEGGAGIASESLQLKYSNMLESRHLCRQRAMSRQCILLHSAHPRCGLLMLLNCSAHDEQQGEQRAKDIAALSLDQVGIRLEKGA